MQLTISDNIAQCMRCPRRGPFTRGVAMCEVNGRHFIDNAKANECPETRFKPGSLPPPRTVAVPRDEWPMAARIVAKLAAADDLGIGDTISRVLDPLGGDVFKRWHKRITGADCDCSDRQARLNAMYPY